MEDMLTPCDLTKKSLSKQLAGWLKDDEEIGGWELRNDVLTLHIKRTQQITNPDCEKIADK